MQGHSGEPIVKGQISTNYTLRNDYNKLIEYLEKFSITRNFDIAKGLRLPQIVKILKYFGAVRFRLKKLTRHYEKIQNPKREM